MSEAVITALITGGISLAGIFVSNLFAINKHNHNLQMVQAITDTKLENLTKEVRKHNGFAERMPVVEEQIRNINHRLDDLEK